MTRPGLRRTPSIAAGLLLMGLAACTGRTASLESEAPVVATPMEADFYDTYDLYFGPAAGAGHDGAPLTATWSARDFVVSQDGRTMIRADIAIDPSSPRAGKLRIWDARSSDPLCAAEGVYDYVDDGTTITLTVSTDPCANRIESADGARLVRRP